MTDYTNGLGAGMAARNAAIRESDLAIAKWESYSNNLKTQLVKAEAGRKGSVFYARELRKVLSQLNPNHPLLKEDVMASILDEGRKVGFAEQGYIYDPKSGSITKRA